MPRFSSGKGVRLNISSLNRESERWCVVGAISSGECRKAPLLGRLEAAQIEVFVEGGVAAHEFCFAAIFHGLGEYGVGVILVEYHEVLVAFAGCGGEMTGLVCGD